jgi:hypothetical protein
VAPLYPQKLTLTSPTSCSGSVGIVRSWTQIIRLGQTIHSWYVPNRMVILHSKLNRYIVIEVSCLQAVSILSGTFWILAEEHFESYICEGSSELFKCIRHPSAIFWGCIRRTNYKPYLNLSEVKYTYVNSVIQRSIHNFWDLCCHLVRTNFGLTGHPPSKESFPRICAIPRSSAVFKMHSRSYHL